MADDEKTTKTAKADAQDVPNVGNPTPVKVEGAVKNAGQPQAEGANLGADEVDDAPNDVPVEEYSLTAVDEDDVPVPALVTLEVVAEGTFQSSTGEYLKTGDRKTVNSVEAKTLLDLTVDGATAFEEV